MCVCVCCVCVCVCVCVFARARNTQHTTHNTQHSAQSTHTHTHTHTHTTPVRYAGDKAVLVLAALSSADTVRKVSPGGNEMSNRWLGAAERSGSSPHNSVTKLCIFYIDSKVTASTPKSLEYFYVDSKRVFPS